jgi:hypothetical protein
LSGGSVRLGPSPADPVATFAAVRRSESAGDSRPPAPEEYGFWANLNPDVPHPRWSQARENFLNDGSQRPTILFTGYGEQVASLYNGLEKEPLYM